jgi:hypothetical protein
MRIYIAAAYERKNEMIIVAEKLKRAGHEVTSRWFFMDPNASWLEASVMDLADIDNSEILLSFTHPRGTGPSGGGRHVEFGYAMAKGKRLVIIGESENVFHDSKNVSIYKSLNSWLDQLAIPLQIAYYTETDSDKFLIVGTGDHTCTRYQLTDSLVSKLRRELNAAN